MLRLHKRITALSHEQVLYPVGPKKDAYSILSWFALDVETNEVTHRAEVVKNFLAYSNAPVVFKGTVKECFKFLEKYDIDKFEPFIQALYELNTWYDSVEWVDDMHMSKDDEYAMRLKTIKHNFNMN